MSFVNLQTIINGDDVVSSGIQFAPDANFGNPGGGFWFNDNLDNPAKNGLILTSSDVLDFITGITSIRIQGGKTTVGKASYLTNTEFARLSIYGGVTIGGAPQVGLWNSRVPLQNITTTNNQHAGRNLGMTIGRDGLPNISYYTGGQGFRFLKCSDAGCIDGQDAQIDSNPGVASIDNSIVIGSDGYPIIAYNGTGPRVKVAKCGDDVCSSGSTILVDSGDSNTLNPSIRIGIDGFPIIAYNAPLSGTPPDGGPLKFVKCTSFACSSGDFSNAIALESDDVSAVTSIAIGSDGYPLILYHFGWIEEFAPTANEDTNRQKFKLVKCNSIDCSQRAVVTLDEFDQIINHGDDAPASIGTYNAITIARDGFPIIVYSKDPPGVNYGELWFSKCSSPDCATRSSEKLEMGIVNQTGRSISLALAPDGLPVITYATKTDPFDPTELKIAKCGDPACSTEGATFIKVAEAAEFVGTALVIGANGLPLVGFNYLDNQSQIKQITVFRCGNDRCIPYWTRR